MPRFIILVLAAILLSAPSFAQEEYVYPAVNHTIRYAWVAHNIVGVRFHVTWVIKVLRDAGDSPICTVNTQFSCYTFGTSPPPDSAHWKYCKVELLGNGCDIGLGVGDYREGRSGGSSAQLGPGVYRFILGVNSYGIGEQSVWDIDISEEEITAPEAGEVGALPDPSDPRVSDWWSWLKKLFTMSDVSKASYDAAVNNLRNAGPWGAVEEIRGALSQTSAYGTLRPEAQWTPEGRIRGVRREAGGERGTESLCVVEKSPLPMASNPTILESSNCGPIGTPWYNANGVLDIDSLMHGAREVMSYAIWVLAAISLIGWVKGKVSV